MSNLSQLMADLIPAATAIAISPIPIAVLVMMLFSRNALKNAAAFIVGWLSAMVAVGGISVLLAGDLDFTAGGQPSQIALAIKLILGGILLAAAYRQWSRRAKPSEEPQMPKWMRMLDSPRVSSAFMTGFALMMVNVKNVPIFVSGICDILQANLGAAGTIIVVGAFTLVASSGLGVPVAFYIFGGEKAKVGLDSAKVWVLRNNPAILAVLFLIFGLKIVGTSLASLLG